MKQSYSTLTLTWIYINNNSDEKDEEAEPEKGVEEGELVPSDKEV